MRSFVQYVSYQRSRLLKGKEATLGEFGLERHLVEPSLERLGCGRKLQICRSDAALVDAHYLAELLHRPHQGRQLLRITLLPEQPGSSFTTQVQQPWILR